MTYKTGKCFYCGNLITKNGLDYFDMKRHLRENHPEKEAELDALEEEVKKAQDKVNIFIAKSWSIR